MLKADKVLYDCYQETIYLIRRHNYPQAQKNINLLKSCLEKSVKESKDPEKSMLIVYLRQWVYHAETELQRSLTSLHNNETGS